MGDNDQWGFIPTASNHYVDESKSDRSSPSLNFLSDRKGIRNVMSSIVEGVCVCYCRLLDDGWRRDSVVLQFLY